MNYDIIAKIIVALSIGGLVADLLFIVAKSVIFIAQVLAKNSVSVDFKANIWIAGILTAFIATYFIFL